MPELEPELIKLALFIVGIGFLLLMKSFWDELQEDNEEFYPDGLDQCPQETYTLDEHGSSRVKCISCPQCPAGTEPTPPCGKTLAVKLTGECVPCGKGTFSDEAGSAACEACFDCGSREVVSSCTTEKDAECKECPSSHYEDQMTHGCKHCSFCCGRNTAAHLECITSKMCKGNCSQMAKFKRKYTYSIFSKLAAKAMNNSHDATSMSTFYSLQKNRQERSIQHENTNTDNPTLSDIIKKDTSVQVADGEATTNSNSREAGIIFDSIINKQLTGKESKDVQFFRRPGISNSTQKEKTDYQRMHLDKESNTSLKIYFQNSAANTVETDDKPVSTTLQPTAFPPTHPTNHFESMMPPTQVPMQMPLAASRTETQKPPLINTSSFLSTFSGTIAAFFVLGLIWIIVYIVVRKCDKRPRGYNRLNWTNSPGQQQTEYDDALDESTTKEEKECLIEGKASEMFHPDDAVKVLDDLNLCEIPPDLEDILVLELDVTHGRGKNKVFGWEKVGSAAGIPRRELKYYQNEYLRPNGSPTKLLLDKLGSQGKTISDLLDVLQKPRVQLGSVAASIRHRVTTL